MRHITGKAIAIGLGIFAAASIALLWSWNTLAELTGAPAAEFRHVLAALIIVGAVRSLLRTHRHHRRHVT